MNPHKLTLLSASFALALASCTGGSSNEGIELTKSGLNPQNFVTEHNGKSTALYTLKNADGMEVCVTNFGGRIVSIMAPDKDGVFKDVVLGFDSIADYIKYPSDFGAAIGRYANRINKGQFVLDGDTVKMPTNNFGHTLHGGPSGWQYQVYDVDQVSDSSITLVMHSPDLDNGFPGNVTAQVKYTLTADNAIDIAYSATTDKPTVINMTNHSYFNLNGNPDMPITNDTLMVNASAFTPVDSTYMTTGEIVQVKETPFDFTQPKLVGEEITVDNEQIRNGNGYDHNWVLDTKGDISVPAAEAHLACHWYRAHCLHRRFSVSRFIPVISLTALYRERHRRYMVSVLLSALRRSTIPTVPTSLNGPAWCSAPVKHIQATASSNSLCRSKG